MHKHIESGKSRSVQDCSISVNQSRAGEHCEEQGCSISDLQREIAQFEQLGDT